MRIKRLLAILGLMATVGLVATLVWVATSAANADQTSASITINGKTFALTHARAWKTGKSVEIPKISIYLAEKDLAGMDWAKGDATFQSGSRGVALILDPHPIIDNKSREPAKEPYRYTIDNDSYADSMYAADCGKWARTPLTEDTSAGMKIADITLSNNVVSGKVEWHGNIKCQYDPEAIVTAWSAQFSIPLEELPKH